MEGAKAMARRKVAGAPCQKCEALEAIILLQNNALDAIGKEIEGMHGGMLANIVKILERHGTHVDRPQRPLQ